MSVYNEAHKQIEDIIDAKKESGQYDALCNSVKFAGQNTRYAYSTPTYPMDEVRDEFAMYNIEGDNNNEGRLLDLNIGPTDSEITLIRVKREGSQFRTQVNNWDMNDKAIPGDGTHLGESPSLVNLVTLVIPSKQSFKSDNKTNNEQEYLIPLSSWEPIDPQPVLCENPGEPEGHELIECEQDKTIPEAEKSREVSKEKSTSSFKGLFKCIVFWKRRNNDEGSKNRMAE